MDTKTDYAKLYQRGPWIDGTGLLLAAHVEGAQMNSLHWEHYGFTHLPEAHVFMYPISKPYQGKVYSARGWLAAALKIYERTYPGWVKPAGYYDTNILPRMTDPEAIAEHIYALAGSASYTGYMWKLEGYDWYVVYGWIKNTFNVTDPTVKRHLQRLVKRDIRLMQEVGQADVMVPVLA